jgi:hypothetical protein
VICIVEDFAGSNDVARPCFLEAKALFKEIDAIIQLVVCKLGEVRRGEDREALVGDFWCNFRV